MTPTTMIRTWKFEVFLTIHTTYNTDAVNKKTAKVVFGREFPQKNVVECLFRHILQDTIFL